mgnify:CR=1 FL=1
MAHWMIRLAEEYFGVFYEYLHQKQYEYHVIQADNPSCLFNKDGRLAGSQSWMWVYRSGYMLNQEKYHRVFFTEGEVPIDNNDVP